MLVGAEAAQRDSGLPVSLMQTIQALVVVFVVAGDALAARLRSRQEHPQGSTAVRGDDMIGVLAQTDFVTLELLDRRARRRGCVSPSPSGRPRSAR